jgi:hypothetical protein
MRAMHGMRCADRCAALVAFARCARIGCDAIRCAGWLHSRGAGGAMLLTEGFLGWGVWADGWAEEWVEGWVDGWSVGRG